MSPIDQEKLAKRLMATFVVEMQEYVRALNHDLLSLEKLPPGPERAAVLKSLFQTAHSLKGAARSVNLGPIECVCHRLEEVLSALREGKAELTPAFVTLLFAAADEIAAAGERLGQGKDIAARELLELARKLKMVPSEERAAPPDGPREAPPEPAVEPSQPTHGSATVGTLRIAAVKLDQLLAASGELLGGMWRLQSRSKELDEIRELVAKEIKSLPLRSADNTASGTRLRDAAGNLDKHAAILAGEIRQLDSLIRVVDEKVRGVLLLPFSEATEGLERMVRDLARAQHREVDLCIVGGETQIDRSVLEALKDPILHMVRNAVDHGIEAPEERLRAGKPRRAKITLSARLHGAHLEIMVVDDGRGLDKEALRKVARKRGLAVPEEEDRLLDLFFLPGISTSPIITDISGRGVGLDVVKTRMEAIHGSVELSSVRGKGSEFKLCAPLTLSTIQALLVETRGQVFAFSSHNTKRLLRFTSDELRAVGGQDKLLVDDRLIPVVSLAETLGLPARESNASRKTLHGVLIGNGAGDVVMAVDEALAERTVTVKNLGRRCRRLRFVSGATLMPSGDVVLLLNTAEVARIAHASRATRATRKTSAATPGIKKKSRLLVAEDSLTTRAMEKSILESAGYEVITAADGEAAWRLLQEKGADLLISDIEMPKLNGFDLAKTLRKSARFRDLPIILVTARESDADKTRGIEIGADAYLGKSTFDQRSLLETVAQLL